MDNMNSFGCSKCRDTFATARSLMFLAAYWCVSLFVFQVLQGCTALTKVDNPNITEQTFLASQGSMMLWQRGCEREAALAIDRICLAAEVVSDNYFNNRTLFNPEFDIPRLLSSDLTIASIAQQISRLLASAEYGLTTVAARDATTTVNQQAELWFLKGMAHMYLGAYFVAMPAEPLGAPLPSRMHYVRATQAFEQALQRTAHPDTIAVYRLALAVVYYRQGDKQRAVEQARASLASNPAVVRFARFDPVPANGATNTMQVALYTGTDEFQPLPRLDFLDPKYYRRSATQESPICLLKSEEAYCIIAEAQLADGQIAQARGTLQELLKLVAQRPVEAVDDAAEERGRRGGTVLYPLRGDSVRVAASSTDPFIAGLMRTRGRGSAPVRVPTLSGTSVAEEHLQRAQTVEQLLELLYLMRQEIFLAEGKRMVDLGIQFPLSDLERNSNPQAAAVLSQNPQWRQAQIPDFIPLASEMNAFIYNEAARTVVIRHNMNRVVVQNRASPMVVPFF